jgi:hypothetical protein
MKATMGAHGIVEAIIPRITAVVPHEQNGVATATPVETRDGILVNIKFQCRADDNTDDKQPPVMRECFHHFAECILE